jgi:hypothetical protein
MKCFTAFRFVALIVIAVVSSPAIGESLPIPAQSRSLFERSGGYARRLPRRPRPQEMIEADMQQSDVIKDQMETPAVEPVMIDSGFIIFNGRYVPPPYTVRSERDTIYINGHKVPQRRPGQFFRRFVNTHQAYRRDPAGRLSGWLL